MKPTYIYNLIAFSLEYIHAWEKRRELDEQYRKMSEEERYVYRNAKSPYHDINLTYGKAYRGSWLDRGKLLDYIKEHPASFHEFYYDYLLIESHIIGELDGCVWGDDAGEIWMRSIYNKTDDGSISGYYDSIEYEVIDKPKCFEQTVSFT